MSEITFKQVLNEVEHLQDELTRMKRMYEDLLYNLDYGNFSDVLNNDMDKFMSTFKEVYPDGSTAESSISQTANGILLEVSKTYETISNAGINYTSLSSSISQTAIGIISTVAATYETKTNVSMVKQTADKIEWLVVGDNYTGQYNQSNFILTSRMADLVADNINLTGYVTFNALGTYNGTTIINGGNIYTGTVSANRIIGMGVEGNDISVSNSLKVKGFLYLGNPVGWIMSGYPESRIYLGSYVALSSNSDVEIHGPYGISFRVINFDNVKISTGYNEQIVATRNYVDNALANHVIAYH